MKPLSLAGHEAVSGAVPAAGGAVLALVGIVLALLVVRRRRLRPPTGAGPTLAPADAALLTRGVIHRSDIADTIVDLAERGHLRVRELSRSVQPEWVLTRIADPADHLRAFEATILATMFRSLPEIRVSEIRDVPLDHLRRRLDDDAVHSGWFRRSPSQRRLRARSLATLLAAMSIVSVAVGWGTSTRWWPLGMGALVAALAWWWAASRWPLPTAEGSAALAAIPRRASVGEASWFTGSSVRPFVAGLTVALARTSRVRIESGSGLSNTTYAGAGNATP